MNQEMRQQLSLLIANNSERELIKLLKSLNAISLSGILRRSSEDEQIYFFSRFARWTDTLDPDVLNAAYAEGLRTNSMRLFSQMVLDNAFPSISLPEDAFNQMVLKALFNDLPVERIIGISSRLNSKLIDQVLDYKQERSIAGRSIPDGVNWILNQPRKG